MNGAINPLAEELNRIIGPTPAFELLSDLGKRLYFPKGIVAQSVEAAQKARKFNATVGMAMENSQPLYLSAIKDKIGGLTPEEIFTYSTTTGETQLRELWQEQLQLKNPALAGQTISLPLVTAGITNAVFTAAELFVEAGTKVILPDLFWGNYSLILQTKKGAQMLTFPFYSEKGGFNLNGLESILSENRSTGKLVLLLNFPNNPTGYTPTAGEAEELKNLLCRFAAADLKMTVILDDAYFGLFFEEDVYRQSLFALLAAAQENILCVKCDGVTKEDLAWGFRVGFITFAARGLNSSHYQALEAKTKGALRANVSNCSKIAQSLLISAFQDPSYARDKQKSFATLYNKYLTLKQTLKGFKQRETLLPLPFNSGYFFCFRVRNEQAEKLRRILLDKYGIGTVSLGDTYLRVAYSQVSTFNIPELIKDIYDAAENEL